MHILYICMYVHTHLPESLGYVNFVWLFPGFLSVNGGFVVDVKIVKKALKVFAFLWLKLKIMLFLG